VPHAVPRFSQRAVLSPLLLSALLFGAGGRACAQEVPARGDKGSFFAHWGYNRAWYSASDIHFEGPGYDFDLSHVQAKDRPEPFGKSYFKLKDIWIPQYNYRIGWHFQDRWSISLGLDHMKYVVVQDQTVRMDGEAEGPQLPEGIAGQGSKDVVLSPDLLTYEHTDGLNLLSIDVDHYDPLFTSRSGKQRLRLYEGLHAGPVIPRTDVRLFGTGINNRFNVAGFGVGAQVGLHFTFLKHFYIRNALKAGWVDLPHVLTTGAGDERADQHFWFVQHAIVVGGQFRIGK
jgi:hypothetical protein